MSWIDASSFSELLVVLTTVATTVLTVQGTNDPTGANPQTIYAQENGTLTLGQATIASAGAFRINTRGFKWIRVQCTTNGGSLAVQGITARMGQPIALTAYGDAVSVSLSTLSTLTTLSNGQTAHSSASTGSPLRIGGRVITTLDTTLTQGDASDVAVTTAQQVVTKNYGSAENDWKFTSSITTTTTAAAAKASAGTNLKNSVTAIQAQNTSATATTLLILDGATTIWQCNLPANMAAPMVVNFDSPLRGSSATALNYNFGTAGATVLLNVQGFAAF
jgi:hypothetical protein